MTTQQQGGAVSTEAAPSGMRTFIELVLGDMQGNALMSVATGRTKTGKLSVAGETWFRYPEQIDEMVEFAERKRTGDARNVYLSPIIYGDQTTTRKGRDGEPDYEVLTRAKSNALWCQTVYMDSDLCRPEQFRLAPSIHVQTSADKGHDYWLLPEPVPSEQASEAAHRITLAHKEDGSDPSGWSENKILRMPTVNTKDDPKNPWIITWEAKGTVYTIDEVLEAYADIDTSKTVAKVSTKSAEIEARDAPAIADLPPRMALLAEIPSSNQNLLELLTKKPRVGEKGWRSEQLWSLLLELFRLKYAADEVLSMAWGAPAASKWRDEDDRGLEGMWGEVVRAQAQVAAEFAAFADEASPEDAPLPVKTERRPVHLLDEHERMSLIGRWDFLAEYEEWARSRVPVLNTPYHRANAWTALSAIFGDLAFIPKASGDMPLNLWFITLGLSSSGKSEALGLLDQFIRAVFAEDPRIPANQSENALIEQLQERDKQVTLVNDDEADSVLGNWRPPSDKNQGRSWASGVPQALTRSYDGPVPGLGRVGKKELRNTGARAVLLVHLMGTPAGMLKVLDESMFKTGFLARAIWVLGHDIPITKDSIKTRLNRGERASSVDPLPTLWAERFTRQRSSIIAGMPLGRSQVPIDFTNEALDRVDAAKWAVSQHFKALGNPEVFRPATTRMSDIMLKACALYALSEGEMRVSTRHVVATLAYVEEWLEALQEIALSIASSAFSQACDDIERYLHSRRHGAARAEEVYRHLRAEPKRKVDEFLDSLISQGRIRKDATEHQTVYMIRQQKQQEAA